MSAQPQQPSPTRWRVRAMVERDLERVSAIEHEIYPFPWSRGNFADSLRAGYDAWVFEDETSMIGYALLMWLPDEEVHLLNLSVSRERQGRGYGRAILAWLCRHSRELGARSLMLEVRPSNQQARALYDSTGFVRIGVRKRYYPSWGNTREDALVLRKALVDA